MTDTSFFTIFVFSFILGIGAVVTPGPVSTAIVSQAPRQGWRVGPLVALGHAFLELIMVMAIAFGFQRILGQANVRIGVALFGGLLLFAMGLRMLAGVLKGQMRLPKAEGKADRKAMSQLVRLGMVTTLANPFWFAWWITVPPSYLAQVSSLGTLPLAAFYLGHISADFVWDSALASLVGGGRRWMNDRSYAAIIALCGSFFVYLGVVFSLEGIELLRSF